MTKEEKKVSKSSPKAECEAKIALYKKQLASEKVAGTAEQVAGTQAEIDGLERILTNL